MVDLFGLIDLQTISIVSAAIGILVGVFNWIRKSSTEEKQRQTEIETRQAQLFMQLYDRRTDVESWRHWLEVCYQMKWENPEDFMQKYGPAINPDAFAKWLTVGNYFVGVGVLVRRKLIELELVYDLMPNMAIGWWDKAGPIVKALRESFDRPEHMKDAEYLCDELRNIRDKKRASVGI